MDRDLPPLDLPADAPRIVAVSGAITDAAAAQAIAALLHLQERDAAAPILLTVDSQSGELDGALALIEAFGSMPSPVHTHCPGQALGPAAVLLAAGAKRTAAPDARIALSLPPASQTDDEQADADEHERRATRLVELFAERTGRPPEVVREDFVAERTYSPGEALAAGVIDRIDASPVLPEITAPEEPPAPELPELDLSSTRGRALCGITLLALVGGFLAAFGMSRAGEEDPLTRAGVVVFGVALVAMSGFQWWSNRNSDSPES